ncbi:MAG: type I DNA topoisomerase [bacterium]|nr:type I DNA topoisomerase [bacterium]
MARTLLIVESPTKARTFQKYLGKDYIIKASKGHVVDLPKSKLGIDLEDDFAPQYVTIKGKGKVLTELKQAAKKVEEVLLATDPDREGEAIAWHLSRQLVKVQPNIRRIMLNEITKEAIAEAVKAPGEVDEDKVDAQQARRVLDRLVGYQISPLLWKIFYYGLSAGRVQTVALRLIVEREEAIRAFVRDEYWSLRGDFTGDAGESFEGKLVKWRGEKLEVDNEAAMHEVLDAIGVEQTGADAEFISGELSFKTTGKVPFTVSAVERKRRKRTPDAPLITSTLQREASSRLGYSARRTMMLAQQLYEGLEIGDAGAVGLITYMRTDSTRIADSARAEHKEFVQTNYGDKYLPAKERIFKAKKGAQDAHEAIRPTSINHTPDKVKAYLSKDQLAVYTLIWQRFAASLMADAEFEATRVDITAGEALFRANGNRLVFDGFRKVLAKMATRRTAPDGESLLPEINEGEALAATVFPRQHFTDPPPRFSESSLIKELEDKGIGRPSTYASIVSTIQGRDYLTLDDNRRFVPTDLGESVWKVLKETFPQLFEVGFTASMEEELDKIEEGDKEWIKVIRDFHSPMGKGLTQMEERTDELRESIREEADEPCEKCGKPMIKTWGRNGRFMACSAYPECRNSRPLEDPEPAGDQKCPKCEADMMIRVGRYGRFAACSKYPDCKGTAPLQIGVPCQKDDCQGQLVEKRSKRGRTFYGCNAYPDCDFASWNKPVATPCPDCGGMVVEKASKAKGNYQQCSVCKLEIPE